MHFGNKVELYKQFQAVEIIAGWPDKVSRFFVYKQTGGLSALGKIRETRIGDRVMTDFTKYEISY